MPQPKKRKIKFPTAEVKADLQARCGDNKPRAFKNVLGQFSDTLYTPAEIEKALRELKQEGKAEFDDLKTWSPIRVTV